MPMRPVLFTSNIVLLAALIGLVVLVVALLAKESTRMAGITIGLIGLLVIGVVLFSYAPMFQP